MRPAESECVVRKFMVAFGSFWKFRRVVKCYNWASNDAVVSLLCADVTEVYSVIRFFTNVMNFQ